MSILDDVLPADLVRREARTEAIQRLSSLPMPSMVRYRALVAWEEAVGLTVDRWEVTMVVLGIYGSPHAII